MQNMKFARENRILDELGIEHRGYFLVTAHRQENVDDPVRFAGIIKGLEEINREFNVPVIYPIHPRSRKMMQEFGIKADGIRLIEPVDYLGFLQLESNAGLVLTDSGGVQEEACILGVPCVTLRDNTERPETVEAGSNMLVGTDPVRILDSARRMLDRGNGWRNPFGDGKAAERIRRVVMAGRMDDKKDFDLVGCGVKEDDRLVCGGVV